MIHEWIINGCAAICDFFINAWYAFGRFAAKTIILFFDWVFASWDLILLTVSLVVIFFYLFQRDAPDLGRKIKLPVPIVFTKKKKKQRPLPFKEQRVQIGDAGYDLIITDRKR